MRTAALGEVTQINPRDERPGSDDTVSFVGMADLSAETGVAGPGHARPFSDVSKGYTIFRDGDLLVAKITPCFENGKIGQASLSRPIGVGSTEFHVVRPDTSRLDLRYAFHFLRQPWIRRSGELRMTGSAGQRRVPASFLSDLQVPLPPIEEQRRIAAILDQTCHLKDRAESQLHKNSDLLNHIFLRMFGDPRANPSAASLTDCCLLYSGATPPKNDLSLWTPEIPWFSPKDLKSPDLTDSLDHVSREAVGPRLRLLPTDTVVMVVRGMILTHSSPVATLRTRATINQDLKALLPKAPLDSDFLATAIRVQTKDILADVSTAAHGTKRLDARALSSIRVPVVHKSRISEFSSVAHRYKSLQLKLCNQQQSTINVLNALQERAFSGRL